MYGKSNRGFNMMGARQNTSPLRVIFRRLHLPGTYRGFLGIWESALGLVFMVPVEGVEPSTFALRMRCSTN